MPIKTPLLIVSALVGLTFFPTTIVCADNSITILASQLELDGTGYYLDKGKWAAINPDERKDASVKFASPASNGRYRITMHVVGENDGNSKFEVIVGSKKLGEFSAPPSAKRFEEGPAFVKVFDDIDLSQGEDVEIRGHIASNDGLEWSRARWSKIVFEELASDPGSETPQMNIAAAKKAMLGNEHVARQPDGNGSIDVTGETKQWHKVTLDLSGPFAAETDTDPNPFTDYRFDITFTHASGQPSYTVPGYFAADGNAAESSATAGTTWRAHLSPDKPGKWSYQVSFVQGSSVATQGGGEPLAAFHGKRGEFNVAATDKTGRDFRANGRLTYTGGHYLKHAGSGEIFLKAGADAPETMLAYSDFDGTFALKESVPLKTWSPHLKDWRPGDPTWQGGKGKGLIGALNYLSSTGANAFSFLTYNAAGDGDNVWPFITRDAKLHYDCSKLDQWGIVFDHATSLGLFLHFKLQENENDDHRAGSKRTPKVIPEALDGGACGPERKLYFRELIARFGYQLALNWNLGEENTQTAEEHREMASSIDAMDPYHHLIVIHSFPSWQTRVYDALIGDQSLLTGASAQNGWNVAHRQTLHWVQASAATGRPWVVCNDEQNPASSGAPPDPGYKGFDGKKRGGGSLGYDLHDIRKYTLWGTLMAGGAGVEYYFGYQLPENDLLCEDFRSRDQSWRYCKFALEFFSREDIPLEQMANADELVGNSEHDNSAYCLAQVGKLYLVYLPEGGSKGIDLSAVQEDFTLSWYNPRTGGALTDAGKLSGGATVNLVAPSDDDWLAVIRR